jgi:hypothetical protein
LRERVSFFQNKKPRRCGKMSESVNKRDTHKRDLRARPQQRIRALVSYFWRNVKSFSIVSALHHMNLLRNCCLRELNVELQKAKDN